MTSRAVVRRSRKSTAFALALSAISAAAGSIAPEARAAAFHLGNTAETASWPSVLGVHPPTQVPFLQPLGITAPAQIAAIARLLDREDVPAQVFADPATPPVHKTALIRRAADSYARKLIARANALAAAPDSANPKAVRELYGELRDSDTVALLAPLQSVALERSRVIVREIAVNALTAPIRDARTVWEGPTSADDLVNPAAADFPPLYSIAEGMRLRRRGAPKDALELKMPTVTLGADHKLKAKELAAFKRDAARFLGHDLLSRLLRLDFRDYALRGRLAHLLAETYWSLATLTQSRSDHTGRVLSRRDLRRIAQDALSGMDAGRSEAAAVREATRAHSAGFSIVHRIPDARLWTDQLLTKARPVHLRLTPQADAREALRLLARDPEVELRLVDIDGSADPMAVFDLMIAQARAHPRKKVVFIFEDADRIKPGVVAALDRLLYPKAPKRPLMPSNARILFISHQDSLLSLSPAARSWFVEFAEGDSGWAWDAVAEELHAAASAALPGLSDFLLDWAVGLYPQLHRTRSNSSAGLSQSSFRDFLRALASAARESLSGNLSIEELVNRLEAATRKIIALADFTPNQNATAKLRLLKLGYGSRRLGHPLGSDDGTLAALARSRIAFGMAEQSAPETVLRELGQMTQDHAAFLPWWPIGIADLLPLDLGRALVASGEFEVNDSIPAAYTPGGTVVTREDDGKSVSRLEFAPGGQDHFEPRPRLSLDYRIDAQAVTPDGKIYAAGGGNRVRIFHFTSRGPVPISQELVVGPRLDYGRIEQMAFTPDGSVLVTVYDIHEPQIRVFRRKGLNAYVQVGPPLKLDPSQAGSSLTVDPKGRTFVVGGLDQARVVRLKSRSGIYAPVDPALDSRYRVDSLAIGPGDTVALGSDATVRVLRLRRSAGRAKWVPVGPALDHDGVVHSVSFVSGGNSLLTGTGSEVRFFFFNPAQNAYQPYGHALEPFGPGGRVVSMEPSADGRMLAVRGEWVLKIYALSHFIVPNDGQGAVLLDGRRVVLAPHTVGPIVKVDDP